MIWRQNGFILIIIKFEFKWPQIHIVVNCLLISNLWIDNDNNWRVTLMIVIAGNVLVLCLCDIMPTSLHYSKK